ncbi:MAG TPA: hypothetical protein VHB99_03160, partial [Pirellulales bacterium]|nr:hypothetical protein [Pirellulales bacterium]
DRHEHIGRGRMGLEPFRRLLNDPRFANTPMYLETPKGQEDGLDLDVVNLTTLRGLLSGQTNENASTGNRRKQAPPNRTASKQKSATKKS